MSGHSKWSTIKHKKAATDAKRASVFTKLAKDVTIAAKEGGGDPEMNFRLRIAVDRAKAANMPKDNIERAIKRGTGELKDEAQIEEIIYEAYGPGQIAMLIKVATDNKNRTLSEIKNILTKFGGKFVEGGGVSWQFEQAGVLRIGADKNGGKREEAPLRSPQRATQGSLFVPARSSQANKEEELEMIIIESGAKDYRKEDDGYFIFTSPKELQKVRGKLEEGGVKVIETELVYLAKDSISVDDHTRMDYEKLLEALDESDDVVEVWDNLE